MSIGSSTDKEEGLDERGGKPPKGDLVSQRSLSVRFAGFVASSYFSGVVRQVDGPDRVRVADYAGVGYESTSVPPVELIGGRFVYGVSAFGVEGQIQLISS